MLKRLKYLVLTAVMFGFSFGVLSTVTVHAQIDPKGQACGALNAASGGAGDCTTAPAGPNVDSTLKLAINLFSLIVGIAAVLMIIVGGLKYITSNGDSGNISGAKNTILYAIIGLVVVALAQVIVKFVLTKSAGATCNPPAVMQSNGKCG